jgi:hypothetical protein
MATRTISNAGGNYNATATWVEGVVPTSVDNIAATATSGQLTINVASAARNIDLTNYNNTITLNSGLTWTISGGAFTNTISSTTTFAGAGTMNFSGASSTMTMNTTSRIPILAITGGKTFTTNWFCVTLSVASSGTNNTYNGAFTIDISGNLGISTNDGYSTATTGLRGDIVFKLTGSGAIAFTHAGGPGRVEMDTSGTYSTVSQGLILNATSGPATIPEFRLVNGNLDPSFRIVLLSDGLSTSNYNINLAGSKQFDSLVLSNTFHNAIGVTKNINLDPGNGLNCRNIITAGTTRTFTTDASVPNWRFRGGSLSASNVSLVPQFRSTSATGDATYNYLAPSISLDSDFTHSFGSIAAIGMLQTGSVNTRPVISSITASTTVNINLISKTSSQCINYNFTDVNAVGEEIVAINGTLLRTTNVTNVYPTGATGGVAGGSFTFVN